MVCPITPKVPVDPSMIDLYRYMFTGKIKFNLDPAVQKDGHFAFDVVGDLQDKSVPILHIVLEDADDSENVITDCVNDQGIFDLINKWGVGFVICPSYVEKKYRIDLSHIHKVMCGDDGPLDGTEFDGMLELSGKIFNVLMELFNGEIDVFFQYDGGPEKKAFTWVLNDGATTPNEVMFNMIMTLWTTILQSYSDAGSEWFNGPVDLNKLIISIKPMDLG